MTATQHGFTREILEEVYKAAAFYSSAGPVTGYPDYLPSSLRTGAILYTLADRIEVLLSS